MSKAAADVAVPVSVSDEDIVIVAAADDNYAAHLTVAFVSVLANTRVAHRCSFFCLDGGITDSKRQRMMDAVSDLGGRVRFVSFSESEYHDYGTVNHVTNAAYFRISIPEIFSDALRRAIYIDCDVIVKGDIEELWGWDVGDSYVAAVEDISPVTFKSSGLAQDQYFNSGVMLLNLDRWRREDASRRVREFKKNHPEKICTNDQCALNGVIAGDWCRLPMKWNQQAGIFRDSRQVMGFERDEVINARKFPAAIHYTGKDKPWNHVCFHPFYDEYRRYADVAGRVIGKSKRGESWGWLLSFKRLRKLWRRTCRRRWLRKEGVSLYG